MNVKLTAAQKVKASNSDDLYKVMQQVLLRENKLRRAQEHFWIIGLDNKNMILFVELLALGQQNRVNINPPEAFRMAIYKLATQAVLVHNHPSGNLEVSKADLDLTDYLYKAGHFLNINILDHLIISETGYKSLETEGILYKLRNSGAWQLIDKTKAELNEMKAEIEREEIDKKARLDIAKKMRADGYTVEVIKKLTKLTLGKIRKL